jgi:hypothetical protein
MFFNKFFNSSLHEWKLSNQFKNDSKICIEIFIWYITALEKITFDFELSLVKYHLIYLLNNEFNVLNY